MISLADRYIKTFKKISRDVGGTKKTQIEILEIKTTKSDLKNILDRINNKKIHVIQRKQKREKRGTKKRRNEH